MLVVVQVVDKLTAIVTVNVEDKAGASFAGAKDCVLSTTSRLLRSRVSSVTPLSSRRLQG